MSRCIGCSGNAAGRNSVFVGANITRRYGGRGVKLRCGGECSMRGPRRGRWLSWLSLLSLLCNLETKSDFVQAGSSSWTPPDNAMSDGHKSFEQWPAKVLSSNSSAAARAAPKRNVSRRALGSAGRHRGRPHQQQRTVNRQKTTGWQQGRRKRNHNNAGGGGSRTGRRQTRTNDFWCVLGYNTGHVGSTTLTTEENFVNLDHVLFNFEGACLSACMRVCMRVRTRSCVAWFGLISREGERRRLQRTAAVASSLPTTTTTTTMTTTTQATTPSPFTMRTSVPRPSSATWPP